VKFSVQLPTDRVEQGDEFVSAEAIAEMAGGIERAGFHACYVTEHPFPADAWLESGGHHSLDPFVALTAAAAATKRLLLHTNILVLAYRNPFLTAKSVASLDAFSAGRVIMGVAAGYLEDEYRALGADFECRNEVTDEALVAIKRAWSERSVTLAGRDYEATGNTMLPRPMQRPHPPIWIGGNSMMAIRRAVRHGQGWSPFPVPAAYAGRTRTAAIEDVSALGARIGVMRDIAKSEGREEPLDVNFVPFGRGMNSTGALDVPALRDQFAELEAAGVTWVSVGLPGKSRAAYLESVEQFGEDLIS
jgi:probable F420-dependent oxidoreductase